MEGSFKNARQALSNSIPPCIPYLGTTLMDLTFIEEGNPDRLKNNLINFEKRKLVYTILSKIEQFQNVSYNFQRVPEIEELLKNLAQKSEKETYSLSLVCEPRNATKKDISS